MSHRLDQTKEEAIVAWVKGVLETQFDDDVSVRWDMQSARATGTGRRRKEIGLPYASLSIGAPTRTEPGADQSYNSLDTWEHTHRRSFGLTVTIFAKERHLELINSLVTSLDLPTRYQPLNVAGLAFWGNTDPIDISAILDTKFELRASCAFTFAYAEEIADAVGEIQDILAQGDISGNTVSVAASA